MLRPVMRSHPIFVHADALAAGSYLPGDYAWGEDVRLGRATLIAVPPADGEVILVLEVAGAATNKQFVLGAGGLGEVRLTLDLGVKVLAGQSVRWRAASFAGWVGATRLALTFEAARESEVVIAAPVLEVWWRSGLERFKVYDYNATTATFTATALADGRTSHTTSPWSFLIAAAEVLRVQSSTLYTAELVAGGWVTPDQPLLEFRVDGAPVAQLTAAGVLHVPNATEQTPVDQTGQFLLGSGAALNAQGALALAFHTPLP